MIAAAGRLLDGLQVLALVFALKSHFWAVSERHFRICQISRDKTPGQENPNNAFMFSQPAKPPRSTGVAVGGGVDKPSARNHTSNKLTVRIKRKATPLQNSA